MSSPSSSSSSKAPSRSHPNPPHSPFPSSSSSPAPTAHQQQQQQQPAQIPDSPPATLPLPLSASLVLTSLPQDASTALARAVEEVDGMRDKGEFFFYFFFGVFGEGGFFLLPLPAPRNRSQSTNPLSSPARRPTVTIRLQPIGAAPQLRQRVFRVSATNRFETVVMYLRRKLGAETSGGSGGGGQSVFCYVNNIFAPGLDEGVGGLWRVSFFFLFFRFNFLGLFFLFLICIYFSCYFRNFVSPNDGGFNVDCTCPLFSSLPQSHGTKPPPNSSPPPYPKTVFQNGRPTHRGLLHDTRLWLKRKPWYFLFSRRKGAGFRCWGKSGEGRRFREEGSVSRKAPLSSSLPFTSPSRHFEFFSFLDFPLLRSHLSPIHQNRNLRCSCTDGNNWSCDSGSRECWGDEGNED